MGATFKPQLQNVGRQAGQRAQGEIGEQAPYLVELFDPRALEAVFASEPQLSCPPDAATTATLHDLARWVPDPADLRRILYLLSNSAEESGGMGLGAPAHDAAEPFMALEDAIMLMQCVAVSRTRFAVPTDPSAFGVRYPWLLTRTGTVDDLPDDLTQRLAEMGVRRWEQLASTTPHGLGAGDPREGVAVSDVLERTLRDHPALIELPQRLPIRFDLSEPARYAQAALGETTLGGLLRRIDELRPEDRAQVQTLLDLQLGRIVPVTPIPDLLTQLLQRANNPELLWKRALVDNPPTLEDLGKDYGVTRERIRQIVAADIKVLCSALDLEEFAPVGWYVGRVRALATSARPVEDEAFQALVDGAVSPELPRSAARRLLVLLAQIVERDGWIATSKSDITSVQRRLHDAVRQIDIVDDGFVRMAAEYGVSRELLRDAADAAECGRWISDTCFIRWGGSAANKAHMVLRLVLTPMTADEIATHCGDGMGARNLANQIGADPRFMRIDKLQRYALSDWGMEEYSGIVAEIKERIERGDGRASKAAIIHEFTNAFAVSESSVHSYLAGPLFKVDGDTVTLADAPEDAFDPKHPGRFAGTVSTPHGWGQQVLVSPDHLRGYSFITNHHVAYANGCRPGDNLRAPILVDDVPSDTEGSVIWRFTSPGVDIGRCRAALQAAGVGEGSAVIIVPSRAAIRITTRDLSDRPPPSQPETDGAPADDAILSFFA